MVCLITLFAVSVFNVNAQEWKAANQYVANWDAVTTKVDGNPFSSGDVIAYTVFIANAITDQNKTNPVEVGSTEETTYTLTLNTEGKYFVGVRTDRTLVDDPDTVLHSAIAWSDDPNYAATPFGIVSYTPPAAPTGLR